MSDKGTPHTEHGEGGRVRKELQNLRKVKAPWYFDAELQQRLAGLGERRSGAGMFFRPIPAYAVSIVSILALGIIGYYTILGPVGQGDGVPVTDSVGTGMDQKGAERPRRFEPRIQPIPPPPQEGSSPSLGQPAGGPSAAESGRVIESGVLERQSLHGGQEEGDSSSKQLVNEPTVGKQESLAVTRAHFDTLRSIATPSDSVDSIHVRPDSLHGK